MPAGNAPPRASTLSRPVSHSRTACLYYRLIYDTYTLALHDYISLLDNATDRRVGTIKTNVTSWKCGPNCVIAFLALIATANKMRCRSLLAVAREISHVNVRKREIILFFGITKGLNNARSSWVARLKALFITSFFLSRLLNSVTYKSGLYPSSLPSTIQRPYTLICR